MEKIEYVTLTNSLVAKITFKSKNIPSISKLKDMPTDIKIDIRFNLYEIEFLQDVYHDCSLMLNEWSYNLIQKKIDSMISKQFLYKVSQLKELIDDLPL